MPINKSALKRERQNIVRRQRNRILKSKVRTAYNALMKSINDKNKEETDKRFKTYTSVVDKTVKKGIYHINKGSRLKSNMSKRIKLVFGKVKTETKEEI